MIFPEDIQYERWLETGQINTIGDIPIEDWPLDNEPDIYDVDTGYDISNPKHPNHYDVYSEIADGF